MVGNFREGFIKSHPQKLKPRKFVVHACKANEPRFNPQSTWNYLYSRQKKRVTLLVSVLLTAIPEAIQEIEMLRKDRRTNQTAAQGREW